jgi:hypothetical protein
MAAWTIVLAFVFAVAVSRVLAMPDFDSTLLALQGLSAGTFLGLKINESTVTEVPEKPREAYQPLAAATSRRGEEGVNPYSTPRGSSA